MKNFKLDLAIIGSVLATVFGLAYASRVVYSQKLVNNPTLAVSTTTTLDLGNSLLPSNIDSLSMQAVISSATISTNTFTDGRASTGAITISSYPFLVGARGYATIGLQTNTLLTPKVATNKITISSMGAVALTGAYVTVNGMQFRNGPDWKAVRYSTGNLGENYNSTGTAKSIADAINLSSASTGVYASFIGTSSVVLTSATTLGTVGNSYTILSSTPMALNPGTTNFAGGFNCPLKNAVLTVNGTSLVEGGPWSISSVSSGTVISTGTAASLASAIGSIVQNTSTGSVFYPFSTSVTGSTVTAYCQSSGTFCNSYTLSASTISFSTVTFANGKYDAVLRISTITLTQGHEWFAVTSESDTAKSLSDAIQANQGLANMISSSWTVVPVSSYGVVACTATRVGGDTNYSWASNYVSTMAITNSGLYGGTDTSVSTTNATITITTNNYSLGLALLFTKSAGTAPGTLQPNATYYAVPVNANTFKLARTSTDAVAGTGFMAISSQTTIGAGSFSLSNLQMTGSPTITWQSSDDGTNFSNISVSSAAITSTNTASSTLWDLGTVNYRYLRFNYGAPTQGSANVVVTVNGKSED